MTDTPKPLQEFWFVQQPSGTFAEFTQKPHWISIDVVRHMVSCADYEALALENSQLKDENAEAKKLLDRTWPWLPLSTNIRDSIDAFLARTQPALDTSSETTSSIYRCTHCNKTHSADFVGQTSCMQDQPALDEKEG